MRKQEYSKRVRKGLSGHPLYTIWCNIKRRCAVEGSPHYYLYGAKGVKLCEEWMNNFKAFHDWCIENGWKRGLEVDKDLKSVERPGKLYSPGTCSIITPLENIRNRSSTEFITYNGITLSVQEWAEKIGIRYKVFWDRMNMKGWSIERIMTTPLVEHSHLLTYNGETVGITEWARRYNMSVNALQKRLKKGWDISKSLETPINQKFISNKNKAAA